MIEILEFVEKYRFKIIPISTVNEYGKCSCNKKNCLRGGKHPIWHGSWKKYATNNIEKINSWLNCGTKYNFAICTGTQDDKTKKYFVVVDIDDKNHELIKLLPKTFYYKTGSDGYHFWFWSKTIIKNSASLIDYKIDIRGKGGYVIIPPSKNINGQYSFLEDSFNEIADLPDFLYENIEKSKKPTKQTNSSIELVKIKTEKVKKDNEQFKMWTEMPIDSLLKMLESGIKIPNGIRNQTLHRLLSSLRGKGASIEDIRKKSIEYISYLENQETFESYELEAILNSVGKYKIYNHDYKKINEIFLSSKLKPNEKVNEVDLEILNEYEQEFFSMFEKSYQHSVSINEIIKIRNEWYIEKGFSEKEYPKYQSQLLAKKLLDLGYEKKKTCKSNLWNIKLKNDVLFT